MPDIFLSYASADNIDIARPWVSQTKWVMCFKVALQQAVDKDLGRSGDAKWFLDAKDLRTGDHLTEAIQSALDKTKVFVAIASTAYFHDKCWCKMERDYFLKRLGVSAGKTRRVVGVILD